MKYQMPLLLVMYYTMVRHLVIPNDEHPFAKRFPGFCSFIILMGTILGIWLVDQIF